MELTPYQTQKFKDLETIRDGVWYNIKPDRPDREEFISCLRLYIDVYRNLEFNRDYTRFRRSYCPVAAVWLSQRDKTVTHQLVREYHDQLEKELEVSHPSKYKKR